MDTKEINIPSVQPAAAQPEPAGFWIRLGAFTIDFVLVWLPIIFILIFFWERLARRDIVDSIGYSFALGLLIIAFYHAFAIGRWGQTLGKYLAGISAVTKDGGKVGYLKAIGRTVLWYIYMFMLLFGCTFPFDVSDAPNPGFFIILIGCPLAGIFLQNKIFLYDYICGTRVIYKTPIRCRRKVAVATFGIAALLTMIYLIDRPYRMPEKARVAEAMSAFSRVKSGQEIYFAAHKTYAGKFTELGLDYHGMTASKIPTKFFLITMSTINCGVQPCYKMTATRHSGGGEVSARYGAYSLSITIPDSPEVRIAACPGGGTNCDELIN